MGPEALQLIERLKQSHWFSKVGQPVESADVNQVDCWDAAAYATLLRWEDLHLELFETLSDAVFEHFGDKRCPLDDVGEEIKAVLIPVVKEKIRAARIPRHFAKMVRVHTTADLSLACLESEFRSVIQVGLFQSLAHWYLEGHFPCGWQGEYPDGQLIIF